MSDQTIRIISDLHSYKIPISILFCTQIIISVLLGLEAFEALVLTIVLLYSAFIFIDPFFSIPIFIILSNFIEGKLIESFVLFRLFNFNWYLTDLVLFISYLSIIPRIMNGKYKIPINPLSISVISFLCIVFINAFWALNAGNDTQSVFYDLRSFVYYLTFLPLLISISNIDRITKILIIFLVIGSIKSGIDVFLSLFVYPPSFDTSTMQYFPFARLTGYSEIVYPTTFTGGIFLLILSNKIKEKFMLIPVVIVSFLALLLSLTRGSWFALLVTVIIGVLLLIYYKRIRVNLKVILSFFLALLTLIGLFHLIDLINLEKFWLRFTSISIDKIDISNLGRLIEYATALQAFQENPVFGKGLGFFFTYFAPGIGYQSTIYCHNSYLYIIAKIGVMGLLPFILIIYFLIKTGFKIFNSRVVNQRVQNVSFCFNMIFIFILIKSFTTWHLNTITYTPFIGILFGIFIYYSYLIRDKIIE